MSDDKDSSFTLKAVIDKHEDEVLFVEIENDLANVFLGFMTLPLGQIVHALLNHYSDRTTPPVVIGSLTNLYNSVANLDSSHFQSDDKKQMLLNPRTAYSSPFRDINLCLYNSEPLDFHDLGKTFIEYSASFIVNDDLKMTHNASCSFKDSLDSVDLAMADLDGAQMRILTFGVNEIMELLEGSFVSSQPLSDIILGTKQMKNPPATSELDILLPDLIKNDATNYDSKGIVLNLMFNKSTKKLLFAQARQDFVDLLFSMLVIPFGVVQCFYKCGVGLNGMECLHGCIENMCSRVFSASSRDWLLGHYNPNIQQSLFTSMEARGEMYVDFRPRLYIVSDDLTVTPFSVCSTMSLLNKMNIAPSDVEEVELRLDLEDVRYSCIPYICLLKSTTALTDALLNIMFKRRGEERLEYY